MVGPTDFDRGLLNSRGLPLPPGPSLLRPRVSDIKAERLRAAASDLGKVYNALRKEDQSLGEWALPKRTAETGEATIGYQVGKAMEKAFAPEPDPQERFWRYEAAFEIAKSEVAPKRVDWAKQALKDQKNTLVALKQEIEKAEFAEWMHQAAKDITQSSAVCRDAAASRTHSEFVQEHQGNPLPDRDLYSAQQSRKLESSIQECWKQATKSFVEKEKGGLPARATGLKFEQGFF